MWYVMQVRVGSEERICQQCSIRIPESILRRSFVPYSENRMKFHGQWRTQKRRLFPGYVFLDTDDIQETAIRLSRMSDMTKILGVGDEIVPLTEEEVSFMQQLGGDAQVVRLSKLMLDGTQVRVLNGPLKGKEGLICKIDKHKRRVYLEVEMFHRTQRIEVGFEFAVEKAAPGEAAADVKEEIA
ncbi:MAG: antiterminator LoaP [Lachnospiraceae bacterium]|nr:antiterminator LoaP [Lachnospiraceae bacterium]